MPKSKSKLTKSQERKLILIELEKQFAKDLKEEKNAQKLLEKEFKKVFAKDTRNEKRKSKKLIVESKKQLINKKRKLNISKLRDDTFHDENGIEFKTKKKDFMLATPVTINAELLNNDFVNFLFLNFSVEINKFLDLFTPKNKYLLNTGYHFYFEGLANNKTFETGFRKSQEFPLDIDDILIMLQKLFTEIKKRFDVYYLRAGSHILKFTGISLEAVEK